MSRDGRSDPRIDAATPARVDALSFKELIREGAERGWVADPSRWFEYRRMRNITEQTYDEEKAIQVREAAAGFARDARDLLEALQGLGEDR